MHSKYLIVNLEFPTSVFEVGVSFPDHCLLACFIFLFDRTIPFLSIHGVLPHHIPFFGENYLNMFEFHYYAVIFCVITKISKFYQMYSSDQTSFSLDKNTSRSAG